MSTYKKYDSGSFWTPVGAVEGSSTYEVVGRGGNLRHTAQLSPDNPYLAQLQLAHKNQDLDALYAQAIEWEADHVNDEHEYKQSLQAVGDTIQAEREAGINPDLAGSSGSGSGASVNNSTIADQNSGIPTANSYAETSLIFEGINTASNLISSFTQLGSVAGGLYEMSELLPSKKQQANSQAKLSQVSADIAEQTKEEVVSGVSLKNINSRIQMARDLADMFGDSSVADITTNLGSFGFDNDQSSGIAQFIDQYRKSPHYKRKREEDIKNFNDSYAYNAANSVEELTSIYEDVQTLRRGETQLHISSTALQKSTVDYLNSVGFGRVHGHSILESTQTNIEGQQLARKQLIHDMSVFCKQIEDVKTYAKWIDTTIESIRSTANKQRRKLTAEEQNIINQLVNKRRSVSALGSAQIDRMYSIIDEVNGMYYYGQQMSEDNMGVPFNSSTFAPRSIFMDVTFGKVFNSNLNASQLMSIFSSAINGVGDLGQAYIYGKSKQPKTNTNIPVYEVPGYTYTVLQ